MLAIRCLAIEKINTLLRYCSKNYIKLQIAKCSFMCVNTTDDEDKNPMQFQNLSLKNTASEVYLGSVITNSVKISDDVNADIKQRQINIVSETYKDSYHICVEIFLRSIWRGPESCITGGLGYFSVIFGCYVEIYDVILRIFFFSKISSCYEKGGLASYS